MNTRPIRVGAVTAVAGAQSAAVGALALLILLGAGLRLDGQAREREMYVSVLDKTGAPVTGLAPDDFVVREDGVAREVLRVSRATAPMQIALLVDNSQAATPAITDLRNGVTAFVEALHGQNEIALITFADRPTIAQDYTRDLAALKAGIGRLFAQPGSGSYTLDALLEVTRGLRKREAGRPVIVLVLVEGKEFSNLFYDQVLDALRASGAALHALVIGEVGAGDFLADEIRNRSIVIDRGTSLSGGRRENLLTSQALESEMKELANELSHQYLVVYGRPQTLVPPEKVEVEVSRPGLVARGTPVRPARGTP